MSTQRHATCTGCKALNRREWVCDLGHRIVAGKKFVPQEDCPKPMTDEELEKEQGHE